MMQGMANVELAGPQDTEALAPPGPRESACGATPRTPLTSLAVETYGSLSARDICRYYTVRLRTWWRFRRG